MFIKEKVLVGALGIEVSYLGWSLGGYPLRCFCIFSTLAFIIFLILFIPFEGRWDEVKGNGKRLIKFPIFWLGLLFLVYTFIQGLNPSWEYIARDYGWDLKPLFYVKWLPNGVAAPFNNINAFRVLMVMASGLSIVCAVWVGIKHRRSLVFLLWVFNINGVIFALLALWQRGMKFTKIFGVIEVPVETFVGSFVYRNHGAAYLNLILAVILGLWLYYLNSSIERVKGAGPHYLCVVFTFIVTGMLVLTLSRGGVLLGVGTMLIFTVALMRHLLKCYSFKWVTCIVTVGIIFFIGTSSIVIGKDHLSNIRERLNTVKATLEDENDQRVNLRHATQEMFQDQWVWGWGAGSFRYHFPLYQERYPPLKYLAGKVVYIRDAHTDYYQFLAEYGVVGCSLLVLMGLWGLGHCLYCFKQIDGLLFMVYVGCGVMMVHGYVDFIFQSPALLLTFCFLLACAGRLQGLRRSVISGF